MSARFCILSSILLFIAGQNLFAGAYQWTDDRKKALVWNNDPQPGDTASWSGGRDEEGYATGPGKLSWYRFSRGFMTGSNLPIAKKKIPISTYSGTMARGKFNGGVMTVDHGKTYHATFVDGRRKGSWGTGPLITKAESAEPATAKEKPESAEAAKSTEAAAEPDAESIAAKKRQPATEEESDVPAEGPKEEKSDAAIAQAPNSKSKTAEASPPLIAKASTEEPDESPTPREPVTRRAALAPGAVRALEKPSSSPVSKKSEATRTKTERIEKATKVAKATPSETSKTKSNQEPPAEGPLSTKEETSAASDIEPPKLKTENAGNSKPTAESSSQLSTSAKATRTNAPPPTAKETPSDDSIESLVGPPSSLHLNDEAKAAAARATPPVSTDTAAAPAAGATKLTAVNAMDIADIEARTRGYDLGEYELPKAEYSAAGDTWVVNYAPREGSTVKKLSVTIQDKNGKAEIKK